MNLNRIVNYLEKSVVKIIVDGSFSGSGFFVSKGKVLTCIHVLDSEYYVSPYENIVKYLGMINISVEYNGVEYKCIDKVPIINNKNRNIEGVYLAINYIKNPIVQVELGEISNISKCFVFGYPEGSNGEGITLEYEGKENLTNCGSEYLYKFKGGQVESGYSGSPVLNMDTGKVFSMIKSSRNINFDLGGKAIPLKFLNIDEHFDYEKNDWGIELDKNNIRLEDNYHKQFKLFIDMKTKFFVGREYVFDEIKNFINKNQNGYFIINGDPGQGKSSILAKYVQDTKCIAYFNIQLQGINKSDKFLNNICVQLVNKYKLPYDRIPVNANDDSGFLCKLLNEVASLDKDKIIIAIDALDEVDENSYRNANILYLPAELPERVFFILTKRARVDLPLYVFVPKHEISLLESKYLKNSEKDVEIYIENRMESSINLQNEIYSRSESKIDFKQKLLIKSENNFMYLYHILNDIEKGDYKDLNLEEFPKGLQGYYEFHWRNMGMMDKPLPIEKIKIIYVLAEILQPVSIKKICDFSNEKGNIVETVINNWIEFLHKFESSQTQYCVYHLSFKDFLNRKDIYNSHPVTLEDIHKRIAKDVLESYSKFKIIMEDDRNANYKKDTNKD